MALALFALQPRGAEAGEAGRAALAAVRRSMQWVGCTGRNRDDDEGTIPVALRCADLVQATLAFAAGAGAVPAVLNEEGLSSLAHSAVVWGVPPAIMSSIVGTLEAAPDGDVAAVAATACRAVGQEGGGGIVSVAACVAGIGESRLLSALKAAGLEQAVQGNLQGLIAEGCERQAENLLHALQKK